MKTTTSNSSKSIFIIILATAVMAVSGFAINYFYTLAKYKMAITKLKLLQSELYRSARMASLVHNEDAKLYTTDLNAKEFAEKYYTPYFPIGHICESDQSTCWNNPHYYDMNNHPYSLAQYSIVTKQHGMTIGFLNDKYNLITLIVDTNGKEKPNKLGKDVYILSYYNAENPPKICPESEYAKFNITGGLHFGPMDPCGIPMDVYPKEILIHEKLPDGCNKNSPARFDGFGTGAACLSYLVQNNWILDKNYPW